MCVNRDMSVKELEDAVKAKLDGGDYDLEGKQPQLTLVLPLTRCVSANLALLRHYKFHPEDVKLPLVQLVLLSSLGALPEPHFRLCTYLLSSASLASPEVVRLQALSKALEEGRYADFWKALGEAKLPQLKGLEERLRAFVLRVVSLTYSRIDTAVLEQMLNGKAPADLKQEGSATLLPPNESNQKQTGAGSVLLSQGQKQVVLQALASK